LLEGLCLYLVANLSAERSVELLAGFRLVDGSIEWLWKEMRNYDPRLVPVSEDDLNPEYV
jgi:hypothetical protein